MARQTEDKKVTPRSLAEVSHLFLSGQGYFAAPFLELCRAVIHKTIAAHGLTPAENQGLILLDPARRLSFANAMACRFLGLGRDTYPGRLFEYWLPADEPFMIGINRGGSVTGIGSMRLLPVAHPKRFSHLVIITDITDRFCARQKSDF